MKLLTKLFILFICCACFTSCGQGHTKVTKDLALTDNKHGSKRIDSAGKTIASRFYPPTGYERETQEEGTFQSYLSNFPLKPITAKVYYYNGALKPNTGIYASVLDIDVGTRDLQQCADAVMRLRAEYLYGRKKYSAIQFNFTNGFKADYLHWAEGNRVKIAGNKVSWSRAKEKDYSYKTFKDYLTVIFTYAGTLSLSRELHNIPLESIEVGDVFIKGGSPGHAVIVVDVAVNKITGKKIFMIAQSYMPAQSIHLLVNENNINLSPWYNLSETDKLYTPEWTFEKSALKRF